MAEPAPTVRAALDASWRRALRDLECGGEVLVGNAATVAGMFLALARGNPTRAQEMLPARETAFWRLVAAHIRQVSIEEREIRDVPTGNVIAIRR